MSKDTFGCPNWGGAVAILWVEAREAAQHPAMSRTPHPAWQWCPKEKPCSAVLLICSALWEVFSAHSLSRRRGPSPCPVQMCRSPNSERKSETCGSHPRKPTVRRTEERAREPAEAGLPAQLSPVSPSLVRLDCAGVSPEGCGLEAAPLISFLPSAI